MCESSELRVCFLAGTLGRGGAERQLIHMLKALQRVRVKARVLCLTKGEALESELEALNVPLEWVGSSSNRPIRLLKILQSLRHEPADILQSAHFYTNLYAAAAARALRVKSIGAIRNDLTSELLINGFAGRWDLRLPDHLIANSRVARDRALRLGISRNRIHLVPNVISVNGEHQMGAGKRNGLVEILFAGRLSQEKRPDRFLRMLSKVAQRLTSRRVKGIMAGDGPLMSVLPKLLRDVGLKPDQVEILGEQTNMAALYMRADILALTSDWEGTPNVLLEAMAFGTPIVATRVGGVPDLLDQDRGLMVEPEDEDGLVELTLRLVNDPALRTTYGSRGRDYVLRFHSPNRLGSQLATIYSHVLG